MKKYIHFLFTLLVVVFVASCDRNDTVMETPIIFKNWNIITLEKGVVLLKSAQWCANSRMILS